ncbi:MerC domain-containing protein [Streptomyces coeruleorubidus]|uniref:Uncharacterized protein n=1 Tax=Streptomyces coeruleorubidus TaxID=116188 RepID=A0A5J6I3V1_STRC4|nr:MerC domain-containing protein [Streptomyces coeruleorubidus]QEV26192.1 hypothetical protein CP976_19975 [Streptomyces coeruleorubidus]
MSASGTAVEADGGSGTGSSRPALSGVRKAAGSALWAVLVPALLLVGSAVGQWVTWLGVVVCMATIAVAASVIGGSWHRAGAATLVSFGGFALMLFAGPAVYEGYMATVGEPVDAVVTQVADRDQRRGPDMFCTVRELGGDRKTYEVSQQENCFGQAEPGDRVEIRKDPLGLLDPRLPDSPDQRNTTEITLAVTAGLTLVLAGGTFYGGQRRRGR